MRKRILWVPDPALEPGLSYNVSMSRPVRRKGSVPESIFKAYDIRGIYPDQINADIVRAIAQAYVVYLRPRTVVLGRDVRKSGGKLFNAVKQAILESGVDVIDIGTVPTDVFYFAAGSLDADGGIMVSASHNPPEWNGLKLSRRGAEPVSSDSGLREIYALAVSGAALPSEAPGRSRRKDMRSAYLEFVAASVPLKAVHPLKIVVNGNFGVSARLFRDLVRKNKLPWKLVGLNDRPDGTFPKGAPNPLLPENRLEMKRVVLKHKADLGLAWDGDGDRVFFVDEKGDYLEGYYATALLAQEMLLLHEDGTILTDPRAIWATQDLVQRQGGRLVVCRPGGSLIAERMKRENAIFAGEMSGHFYFRNNFNRDNGFLPVLLILNRMFREKRKLSSIAAPLRRKYPISGEINFPLPDQSRAQLLLESAASHYQDGSLNRVDGISVEYPEWRFNLRASNTEPLLRLNLEARDKRILARKIKELSEFVSGG